MQISAPTSINFEAKGYYISPKARANAETLLKMMKKNTSHKFNPISSEWHTEILSSLNMKDKIKFSNARLFTRSTTEQIENKTVPDCTLIIGKNILNINSETGQILSYKTGIFSSINGVIRKANKYINDFMDNFNNTNVVKRNTFKTGGYIELV